MVSTAKVFLFGSVTMLIHMVLASCSRRPRAVFVSLASSFVILGMATVRFGPVSDLPSAAICDLEHLFGTMCRVRVA